jgi:hypothetical protein
MRTASSSQDAFHRRVLSGGCFRTSLLDESPPPVSRLRRRRSGFRRFFTPPSLSRGGARPTELSVGSSPTGPRGHAPLVDFCNRYDPRARPRSSELRRTTSRSPVTQHFSRALVPCDIRSSCEWLSSRRRGFPLRLARTTASRDVSGQGLVTMTIASHQLLPQRSLARELCPNPGFVSDTSCRRSVVRSSMESRGAPAPDGAPRTNRPGVWSLP